MGAAGRAARLAVAAAILGTVLVAQLDRHDDWFPLGMLGQYAVARDPDGEVVNTYLVGEDAQGRQVPITLRAETAGLTRVELEIALGRGLREDPAPLSAVARTFEDNHPGTDLVALEVRQRVDTLSGGGRVGPPTDRLVLRWEDAP